MAEQIIEMSIADIKPYENNPRKNDKAVDAVAASIKKFGWKNPIIVDADNVIIAGHTRYNAAKKLKLETVPCIRATDLTEEQAKAYRLADNKTGELATWDDGLLKVELSGILNIDLSEFGFDEKMISDAFDDSLGIVTHRCPKCGAEWTET